MKKLGLVGLLLCMVAGCSIDHLTMPEGSLTGTWTMDEIVGADEGINAQIEALLEMEFVLDQDMRFKATVTYLNDGELKENNNESMYRVEEDRLIVYGGDTNEVAIPFWFDESGRLVLFDESDEITVYFTRVKE